MVGFKAILVKSGLLWCLLSGTVSEVSQDIPPQIDTPVSQDQVIVDVYRRQHYTIPCNARGHPAPTYKWKKDDMFLDNTNESIKVFENGTLYFRNFSDTDNGFYQCLATNKHGTSVSVKVPLVNIKPAEKADQKPQQINRVDVTEGQPVTLSCGKTPHTVPEYIKRWYLRVGSVEFKATQRYGTDSEGNLRFAFVQPGDSKIYNCGLVPTVLNPRGEINMYSSVELNVIRRTSGEQKTGPQLQFKSTNVKAVLGKQVTLECFFSGNPAPNITWKSKRYGEITSGNSRFEIEVFGRRKLTINKVEIADEEGFSCTATNGFGNEEAQISVNVTSPPMKIPYQIYSMVKSDRHDITLHCNARAAYNEHLNVPVWYKNGVLLNHASLPDLRYSFSQDFTELHMQNPDKTVDTASFQCNVSNSEGYAFYDGYLKVIESIKITVSPPETIEVSRDTVTDISISATGDSCCTIVKVWFLNGVDLTQEELDSPPFIRDPNSDSLLFNPSLVSNETLVSRLGNYTCNVTNGYDFQEVKFYITMKPGAAPVQSELAAADVGFELWWVAIICGLLVVIIAILIVVFIFKSNYPGETYPLEKTELKHHLNPEEDLLEQHFQQI